MKALLDSYTTFLILLNAKVDSVYTCSQSSKIIPSCRNSFLYARQTPTLSFTRRMWGSKYISMIVCHCCRYIRASVLPPWEDFISSILMSVGLIPVKPRTFQANNCSSHWMKGIGCLTRKLKTNKETTREQICMLNCRKQKTCKKSVQVISLLVFMHLPQDCLKASPSRKDLQLESV